MGNELDVKCHCHHYDHTMHIYCDPDDGLVSFYLRIDKDPNFFRRIWNALKYIFKPNLVVSETLVDNKEAGEIARFLIKNQKITNHPT